MNYDTISFITEAVPNEYYGTERSEYLTENHHDLKITVLINGTPVNWNSHIDVYDLVLRNLDHKPRYNYWAGPKHEGKVIPDAKWSVFQPFTCSCGVASCAGIWNGIYIKERGHSIEWRAKSDDGYGFLPKTFFNFEKPQYKQAFANLLTSIIGLCSDYPNTILVVDQGHSEDQLVTGLDFLEYVKEYKQ